MPFGPYWASLPVDGSGRHYVDQPSWDQLVGNGPAWPGNVNANLQTLSNLFTLNLANGGQVVYPPSSYQVWTPEDLIGTSYSTSTSSWSSGTETLTVGTHHLVVGQYIHLAGFTTSGASLNITVTQITAVTGTTVSFALASTPGTVSVYGTITAADSTGNTSPAAGWLSIDGTYTPNIYTGAAWVKFLTAATPLLLSQTPLTTKGDILSVNGTPALSRLGVGSNGQVLTANSSATNGVDWEAANPLTTKGDVFTYGTAAARLAVGGSNGLVLTVNSSATNGIDWESPTPLTTKGDILTYGTSPARLPVGASNGLVLTVNSAATNGVDWESVVSSPVSSINSRAHNTTNQAIASGTPTVLTWNTNDFDNGGVHSTSSNPTRFTIPTAQGGIYWINARVVWQGNVSGTYRRLSIYKNGTEVEFVLGTEFDKSSSVNPTQEIGALVQLAATDIIEFYVAQDIGTNLNVLAAVGSVNSYGAIIRLF